MKIVTVVSVLGVDYYATFMPARKTPAVDAVRFALDGSKDGSALVMWNGKLFVVEGRGSDYKRRPAPQDHPYLQHPRVRSFLGG